MKTTLIGCHQCSGFQFIEFHYFDDGIAQFKCDNGHEITCFVQGVNFEKLLESGVHALTNKNTLEACAVFYAAYERCLEFATDVFCHDDGISLEALKTTKKSMSSQSERQLGAFLIMYMRKMGEPYALDQKVTTFRNKVIHKGYIPNEQKAHDFCKKVYEMIAILVVKLKLNFGDSVQVVRDRALAENAKNLDRVNGVTMMTTQFFHIPETNIELDFDVALRGHVEAINSFSDAVASIKRGQP